jgi:hypothetical protein
MIAALAGSGAGVGVGFGFLEASAAGTYNRRREKFLEEAPGKEPFTDCRFEQIDIGSGTLSQVICQTESSYAAFNRKKDETAQNAKDAYREANRTSTVGGATALVAGAATFITFLGTTNCMIRRSAMPEAAMLELEDIDVVVEEKNSPKKTVSQLTLNERFIKTKSTRPIPEDFLDPVDMELMSKPMLLESTRTIDKRTLDKLDPRVCPITKIPIKEPIFNRALFECIEKFVMEEEARAALRLRRAAKKFICPLTHDIMEDPVIASDGGTYEKKAIMDRIREGNLVSPLNSKLILIPIYDFVYVQSDDELKKRITGYLMFEKILAQNRLEKDAKSEETVPLTRSMSQNRLIRD